MRSFPYTQGSISQCKKLSGAGNPQNPSQVPQLDWFDSLQQQYVASDGNLNEAGVPASIIQSHATSPSPHADTIGDEKFLTQIINTTYAYPDEATALSDQTIGSTSVVNPMKYPTNFRKTPIYLFT